MSAAQDPTGFQCDTLAVVGVGLIGGTIALHARRLGVARRIIGVGRDAARLQEAREAGLIDTDVTDTAGVPHCDIAVVCTPVHRIVEDVQRLAAAPNGPQLITDAGSIKGAICTPLADESRFVGAHPLAGSEKRGFEHAAEVQLQGRTCVLTPPAQSPAAVIDRIRAFWRSLGMQVVVLQPPEHDAILARTSHFPHLAAYALAAQLQPGDNPFAASGFRDATRIAGSDPELWKPILALNRDAVLKTLRQFGRTLQEIESLLAEARDDELAALLSQAQRRRITLEN